MFASLFIGPVGRKLLMALTGFCMALFAALHMAGNMTFHSGTLNAYAAALRDISPLLWTARVVLFSALALHVWTGVRVYLENRTARPVAYAKSAHESSTLAGRTMLWSGLLVGGFITYHLLHFTMHIVLPELSAATHTDATGRPDVLSMVRGSFMDTAVAGVYAAGLLALLMHLWHGLQSLWQSAGLMYEGARPGVIVLARLGAFVIFIGFLSVPLIVLLGMAG